MSAFSQQQQISNSFSKNTNTFLQFMIHFLMFIPKLNENASVAYYIFYNIFYFGEDDIKNIYLCLVNVNRILLIITQY